MKKTGFATLVVIAALLSPPAEAGIYSDQFGKCLVDSTDRADRNILMRWIAVAYSQADAAKGFVQATPGKLGVASKDFAKLVERLLLKDCLKEAREATHYEGGAAFQSSFQTLGTVAGREIALDPNVGKALGLFTSYLDKDKVQQAMQAPLE